eukprot:1325688-Rhodomonas_salina.1
MTTKPRLARGKEGEGVVERWSGGAVQRCSSGAVERWSSGAGVQKRIHKERWSGGVERWGGGAAGRSESESKR